MITDHRLDGADTRYGVETHGELEASLVVLHFTQMGSVESSVELLNGRGFGYHVLIDRDGTVHQLAPFDRVVHHAGLSNWRGRDKVNEFAIGVSFANHGPLKRCGDHYQAAFGERFEARDVLVDSHHNGHPAHAGIGWEPFPQAQVDAALHVCARLVAAYPIREIVRHDDISIGRRLDTGPALDLAPFARLTAGRPGGLINRHVVRAGTEAVVRSTHSTRGRKVGELAPRTPVYVLSRAYRVWGAVARESDWCLVSMDGVSRCGFVRADALERAET